MSTWENASTLSSTQSVRMDGQASTNESLGHWKWRNSRKMGLYRRYDRIGAGVTVVAVLASTICVLAHGSVSAIATCLMLVCACMLWFDSLGIVQLFIANALRKLLSINVLMWIVGIYAHNDDYLTLMLIITVIILVSLVFTNKMLLRSENWKYTDAVQHGLLQDPDNESGYAWKIWGKVACRTTFGNMGFPVDDETIDNYAKPIFYVTYFKTKGQTQKMLDKINVLTQALADSDIVIEELRGYITNYVERIEELEESVERLSGNRDGRFQKMKAAVDALKQECQRLQEENDRLKQGEPETVIEVVKEIDESYLYMSEEQRMAVLFKKRYDGDKSLSFAKLAEMFNCSKSGAEKRYKKWESEYEQQDAV